MPTLRSAVPSPTLVLSLVDHIHGCGQVPHLDAAIGVASEQVAPRPGAHPAGALTLSHSERGDCSAVYSLDLTNSERRGGADQKWRLHTPYN